MFPIFVDFGCGRDEEVEIPENCNDIKEFLEKKYPEYEFDEESLIGLEYGSKVKAQVSFKCFKGKRDYEVLKIGNDLSKMYIESSESLNFSDSDFVMSDLEGYDFRVTKINLGWCKLLENLEGCPEGVTKFDLRCCVSLKSLKGCPESVTELNLCMCKSLESLEGCPECVTELDLRGCESLRSLEGYPKGVTELDLRWCKSLLSLEGCPQGVTELDLGWCRSLESLEGCPEGVTELNLCECDSLLVNNNYIPAGCKVTR